MRRLAAIGVADVPSYLRLVEADRKGRLARLGSLRHDLIDPKTGLHKERALKPTGAVEPTPIVAG